jgi:hypothetical protein
LAESVRKLPSFKAAAGQDTADCEPDAPENRAGPQLGLLTDGRNSSNDSSNAGTSMSQHPAILSHNEQGWKKEGKGGKK